MQRTTNPQLLISLGWKAVMLVAAASTMLHAQGRPGAQNHPPVVNSDTTVTFTIEQPNAKEVRFFGDFGGGGQMPLMQKTENNLWTYTTAPVEPGTYHYSFLVDGVLTPDPSNSQARDWRNFIPWVNIIEIRGADQFLYDPNPSVPHGQVRIELLASAALNRPVSLYIYTPPGYDSSGKQYPVLYLLHGTDGSASQWSSDGRMEMLADNLIAAGGLQEMMLVSIDANVSGNSLPLFEKYMVEEIMPFVEGRYRTLATQQTRAIAGASRGGNQAFHVALKHPELFSALGIFHNALPALASQTYPALQDVPNLNRQFRVVVLAGATEDSLVSFSSVQAAHTRLDQLGVKHTFRTVSGDHSWHNFRKHFIDFVGNL